MAHSRHLHGSRRDHRVRRRSARSCGTWSRSAAHLQGSTQIRLTDNLSPCLLLRSILSALTRQPCSEGLISQHAQRSAADSERRPSGSPAHSRGNVASRPPSPRQLRILRHSPAKASFNSYQSARRPHDQRCRLRNRVREPQLLRPDLPPVYSPVAAGVPEEGPGRYEMTPRQRMKAFLHRQPIDRTPNGWGGVRNHRAPCDGV
jgi:hypothetical protein